MLRSAAIFLLIALVGFGGIAGAAAGVAKFLFFFSMVTGPHLFILRIWHGEESYNSGQRQANQAKRPLHPATQT
jgi:uncharacterized membrane protein YtjA (UPF0391 family)